MKLVVAVAAAATVLSALPATAAPAHERPAASIPKAVVKASASEVTEGDRLSLKVRVPQAKNAERVTLQLRRLDVFGGTAWDDVASTRAKSKVAFRTTVTAQNAATYRVSVTYRDRTMPVVSKPIKVTVWRWIELREFTPYFETSFAGFGEAPINGTRYATWGGYTYISSVRSWEARVTPGRNCTRFRAVLGLADTSDDGSSGVVSFAADEAAMIYTSPTLTPGMTAPVELELARPYRFGMTATNTSPEKVKGFPMVGNGAFYCTGIE